MGILSLRNSVFRNQTENDDFDKAYDYVLKAFLNARAAAYQLVETWREHLRKVSDGEIARAQGQAIQIDESIDTELKKQTENFLNASVRALKGMQNVTKLFGVDVGFFFQKPNSFSKGIAKLESKDSELAEYLRRTRSGWSERLIETRNAIEHEGWALPDVLYSLSGANVIATEPSVAGQPVSEFVTTMTIGWPAWWRNSPLTVCRSKCRKSSASQKYQFLTDSPLHQNAFG